MIAVALRRSPPSLDDWRADFAQIAEEKANSAIRLAASEPGSDYEATILTLLVWRAKLRGRAG